MPLPMVMIMQSGKAAAGKQNCIKEYMVIPSPGLSYAQVHRTLHALLYVHWHLEPFHCCHDRTRDEQLPEKSCKNCQNAQKAEQNAYLQTMQNMRVRFRSIRKNETS